MVFDSVFAMKKLTYIMAWALMIGGFLFWISCFFIAGIHIHAFAGLIFLSIFAIIVLILLQLYREQRSQSKTDDYKKNINL